MTAQTQPDALRLAYEIGANRIKVMPTEAERLRFEQWMAGHCWKVGGVWNGTTYLGIAEHGDYLDPQAMHTRQLFAAWRDCAALRDQLAAQAQRTPLTDEQIDALWGGGQSVSVPQLVNRRALSRSVERAHGITHVSQG